MALDYLRGYGLSRLERPPLSFMRQGSIVRRGASEARVPPARVRAFEPCPKH